MANGYISKIRDRVLSAEDGTVFAASDFADIADTNTIRQVYTDLCIQEHCGGF